MPVLQNLYQIYKLPSTKIVEANLNIKSYTRRQAIREGCLVSIGDNLVFHKIRSYHGDFRSHREIFESVQNLRRTLKQCKKQGQINEARIVNQQITDILFVQDIINVLVVKKGEYKKLARDGFYVNGIHYVRFCCGSGQMRRNTITFINAELYPYVYESLMCGLAGKIKKINLAKLSAYFALSFSSILWVRTPRVCVVPDFFTTIKDQKVDYILKDKDGKGYIEERKMDIKLNSADGQGLIDPQFAADWAEDMNLDYVPSSFVVRSVFVKGNVVPFDFKEYARQNGIQEVEDIWGRRYYVEDVDILLSASQFKLYKWYTCWQEYLAYCKKYDIRWGVARYNKKYDDEYVLTNYQYLQCLNINREDVKELIAPTIDWIHKICSGDDLYTLLYLFGCKGDNVDYNQMYGSAQATFTKAIVKNNEMLKDEHVRRKIYNSIVETINKAKIGKVWVHGNYQFMISDPVAQCQNALGLNVEGLIPADSVYSNFWRERGVNGEVDICRSPMIDEHEHNPSALYESDEANYWYQYIKSGVIFSIYDTATVRMEDADFDGDIILSTDNPVFLRGAQKWHNVITYEKEQVPVQDVTHNNIIKTDVRGLGTGVGGFSNCATIIETMKAIFTKDTQKEQYNELCLRKKLLREIVGAEIDRIKGTTAPVLPSEWRKFERVYPDDTDAVKAEKYRHNSMVISKKPYFFRYLYPELNKRFKRYESAYDVISKDLFGLRFKKLMAKQDKTEEEKTLVRRYQKYSPLIVSNCTMNILCREFENADFDIKFRSGGRNMLAEFERDLRRADFEPQPEVVKLFINCYRKYNNKKAVHLIDTFVSDNNNDEDVKEIKFFIADSIRSEIQQEIFALGLSVGDIFSYIAEIARRYAKFNWNFAWEVMEDFVVGYIPQGESYAPIKHPDGLEYLGDTYALKEVTKEEEHKEEITDD